MSKNKTEAAPLPFEPEFIAGVKAIFEEKIAFNRVLGLKITRLSADGASGAIQMRPDLVGHFQHNRLHGGVIATCLDSMGGLAVLGAMGARHMDEAPQQRLHRFVKMGTIDLRIDYLRQAIGESFVMHGEVIRLGSRVANTRMEFLGADGTLLATGCAAFIVS